MNEWNVVLVVISLVGFVAVILPPVIKLNGSITKLATCFDNLTLEIKEFKTKNDNSHDKIWCTVNEHDDKINQHDTRITVLEKER